jgi:hypothetical protein
MSKTYRYNIKESGKDFSNSKQKRFSKSIKQVFTYDEYRHLKFKKPLEYDDSNRYKEETLQDER